MRICCCSVCLSILVGKHPTIFSLLMGTVVAKVIFHQNSTEHGMRLQRGLGVLRHKFPDVEIMALGRHKQLACCWKRMSVECWEGRNNLRWWKEILQRGRTGNIFGSRGRISPGQCLSEERDYIVINYPHACFFSSEESLSNKQASKTSNVTL